MFREETLNKVERRTYEEPEGEFIELIESGNNTLTVLTRIDGDKGGEVEPPIDPDEYSVSELRDELAEIYDESRLKALLEAEKEGKDRKTAKQAIEDQL